MIFRSNKRNIRNPARKPFSDLRRPVPAKCQRHKKGHLSAVSFRHSQPIAISRAATGSLSVIDPQRQPLPSQPRSGDRTEATKSTLKPCPVSHRTSVCYTRPSAGVFFCLIRNSISTTNPCGTLFLTYIFPPSERVISLTIASPSPEPPVLLLRDSSLR